jgi:GNAT superfamily N-acetyltransferase
MEAQVHISVYECNIQWDEINKLAETIQSNEFDSRVQPWADGCQSEYPRYHFLARADDGNILGWMTADIRTHTSKSGREWTYVYLDKVSARNGTKGVGKALGEYLKTWAEGQRKVDFIWLWAINERVSAVYEASWLYKRVQYYDGYGFMFYTIRRPPPLSMLQSVLPEHPRVYWVAADMVAKMNPPNEVLIKLIATKRRDDVSGVKQVLETLIDALKDLSPEEVSDVQQQLLAELSKKGGRRRKTRTRKHRGRARKTRRSRK